MNRFDYLQTEARRLRKLQDRVSPISKEWLVLEMQIAGCFMMQSEETPARNIFTA